MKCRLLTYNARQRGAALITALFVMVLAAIISTAILVTQRLHIADAELLQNAAQLRQDLLGVKYWAVAEIYNSMTGSIATGILKHNQFPIKSFQGATLSGHLIDAQSLFNINALQFTSKQVNFDQLLTNYHIKAPAALSQNISNWMAPGNISDDSYSRLKPAYRPGHQLMVSKTELRAVLGMTQKIYQKLAPYIIALPETNLAINVNTASTPMLMAAVPGISRDQAAAIKSCASEVGGISNKQALATCLGSLDGSVDSSDVGFTSQYFLLTASASQNDQQLHLQALLQLIGRTNNHYVQTVWQVVT